MVDAGHLPLPAYLGKRGRRENRDGNILIELTRQTSRQMDGA